MNDKLILPSLVITQAVRVEGQPHLYELSLKDVPQEGADVTIQATSYGTDKDTLMIRFDGRTVQTEELDNDPQVTIHTRLSRELLLSHVGTRSINYMIRISQGNGEMGEAQVYLIKH